MSDCAALAILLGASSIVLWGGVAVLARSKADAVSTCFLAGFATLSTLMAFGPVMTPGA
jgi:hypothetical protein